MDWLESFVEFFNLWSFYLACKIRYVCLSSKQWRPYHLHDYFFNSYFSVKISSLMKIIDTCCYRSWRLWCLSKGKLKLSSDIVKVIGQCDVLSQSDLSIMSRVTLGRCGTKSFHEWNGSITEAPTNVIYDGSSSFL